MIPPACSPSVLATRAIRSLASRATSARAGEPAGTNVHDAVTADVLWSCTACSACVFVCPVRIDPLTLILEMRRHLVAEGALTGTAATALRRMQSAANPWGLPPSDRTGWIGALNAPAAPPNAES